MFFLGFQNLQQTIARQGDDFSQNNGIVQGFISLPKPVQVGLVAGTLAYGTLCVQYDCIHGLCKLFLTHSLVEFYFGILLQCIQ